MRHESLKQYWEEIKYILEVNPLINFTESVRDALIPKV